MNPGPLLLVVLCLLATAEADAETLGSFLGRVKDRNLQLSAQAPLVSAAEARSKGLSLNAPMIGVSKMRSLEGPAYAFEVQQDVPLSSRLFDDKRARESAFDVQRKESELFTTEKLLEARLAFVNFWKNYEKIRYLKEVREWLRQHATYVRSVVRSDSATNVYALEIQSYLGILENDISNVEGELETQKARLREFAFDETYDPGIPELDDLRDLPEATALSRITSINQSRLRVAGANLDVAKTSYYPNLFLKARQLDRPMMGMANQEIMVGVDLPFAYLWRPRAENATAVAEKTMAEADYRRSEVEDRALKESLQAKARILKAQIRTLNDVSIPAASRAMKYARNISPRDMSGLETHRRVFEDYIELRSQLLEIRMAYEEIYSRWSLLFVQGNTHEI